MPRRWKALGGAEGCVERAASCSPMIRLGAEKRVIIFCRRPSASPSVRPSVRRSGKRAQTAARLPPDGGGVTGGAPAGESTTKTTDRPRCCLCGVRFGVDRGSLLLHGRNYLASRISSPVRPSEATETLEVSSFSVLCSNPCNRSSPSPPPSWLPLPPPPPPSSLVPPSRSR